jgi:membrane fusion protein (multidrug efflux system)
VQHAFSRSIRALSGDGFRTTQILLVSTALCFGLWLTWFFRASVPLYEVSDSARTQVIGLPIPIQPPCDGQVIASNLALGRDVSAGELLVELDSRSFQLELQEEHAYIAALRGQMEALAAQRAEAEFSLEALRAAADQALREADAQHRQAVTEALGAETDAQRSASLYTTGNLGAAALDRIRTQAESSRAAVERFEAARERVGSHEKSRLSDQRALLEELRGDRVRLEGEIDARLARAGRLEHEIERRRIRAPVHGRLGLVFPLGVGQVVEEAQHLATIVPTGGVGVVAEFPAESAVGRMRPGQGAWFQAEAFPWARHGRYAAVVASVASEPHSGAVRAELRLQPGTQPVPLQHGLAGSVEVEVEHSSPWGLVLRAVHAALRPGASSQGDEPSGAAPR